MYIDVCYHESEQQNCAAKSERGVASSVHNRLAGVCFPQMSLISVFRRGVRNRVRKASVYSLDCT